MCCDVSFTAIPAAVECAAAVEKDVATSRNQSDAFFASTPEPMKTSLLRTATLAAAILSLLAAGLQAQAPDPVPQTLAAALKIKGGKIVVFQPVQMKRSNSLVVSYTQFGDGSVRPGFQKVLALAIYSTDPADGGKLLGSQLKLLTAAGAGGGPHVKVFDGFSPDASQKGIIAILIGLLLPAVQTANIVPQTIPLPGTDAISAEIHDTNALIGLLLPAVQKVREAASR
jgi:hypothetical protein